MAEVALVLSADKWSMPDEKTGQVLEGYSVWFVNDYRDDTADSVGFKPTKISATPEMFKKLQLAKLPGVFEMVYGSRPGAQGKATLTLVDIKYISDIDLFGVSS